MLRDKVSAKSLAKTEKIFSANSCAIGTNMTNLKTKVLISDVLVDYFLFKTIKLFFFEKHSNTYFQKDTFGFYLFIYVLHFPDLVLKMNIF